MPPFFFGPLASEKAMTRERLVTLFSAAVLFAAGALAYAFVGQGTAQNSQNPVRLNPPAGGQIPTLIAPSSMADVQLTFAPVVKRVAPAVVNVYARTVVQQQVNPLFADPFFSQFFGGNPEMRQRVQQSLGSGVIVRADGIILTNNHVVDGGNEIVVALNDKREFKARVLTADPRTDLAVLKIDTRGEKLPFVPFADSDQVQVGDLVLAVGDPFGVGQTVTMGIVSAQARTQVAGGDYQYFIQTDAAINPGNSGGALVTTSGRLAGINTAIYSRSGGSVGIGFAIPANLARRVVEGVEGGQVSATTRGVRLAWAGVNGQPVTSAIAASLGLAKPGGVLIKDVYPGGPLANAGVKSGDVVQMVDGAAVDDLQALNYRIATHPPGARVRLTVASGKASREVMATVALPPETPPRETQTVAGRNPLAGAKIENLSPAVALDVGADLFAKGVVITDVADNSIAAAQGFRPGDIIRAVNGDAVYRTGELVRALNGATRWQLTLEREGRRLTAVFG
jgi:Do/DeqQ family serine protease